MTRVSAVLFCLTLAGTACGTVAEPSGTAPAAQPGVTAAGEQVQPSVSPTQSAVSTETPTQSAGSTGREPAGAVRRLIDAVSAGDPLGVLATLDPAEREVLSRLYTTGVEAAEAEWPQFAGEPALMALDPRLSTEPLAVDMLTDNLAWVTTDYFALEVRSPTAVTDAFVFDDGPWTGAYELARGHESTDYQFYDHPPGLVVVRLDDGWYVSLARTAAEYLRLDHHLPADHAAAPDTAPLVDAPTPEAAVEGFFAAAHSGSWSGVRSYLVAAEAAAFADYEDIFGPWALAVVEQLDWAVSAGGPEVVLEGAGSAVVELDTIHLTAVGDWEYGEIWGDADAVVDIAGLCGRVVTGREERVGCADARVAGESLALVNLLPDLGWGGPRIVVRDEGGQWRVSLYETVLLWGEPFAAEPLFTLASVLFDSVGPWVLADEASKAIEPIPPGQAASLVPAAAGRMALGVVQTGPDGASLGFSGPGLSTDGCFVSFWLQDLATQDLDEGPDYYEWAPCAELGEGFVVPPDSTVVIEADAGVFGSRAIPLLGDITVAHG